MNNAKPTKKTPMILRYLEVSTYKQKSKSFCIRYYYSESPFWKLFLVLNKLNILLLYKLIPIEVIHLSKDAEFICSKTGTRTQASYLTDYSLH